MTFCFPQLLPHVVPVVGRKQEIHWIVPLDVLLPKGFPGPAPAQQEQTLQFGQDSLERLCELIKRTKFLCLWTYTTQKHRPEMLLMQEPSIYLG